MSEEPSYKTTLNLPATAFPMKANLAQREPETLARWESEDLYGRIQRSREGRPLYVLHDGPPYANGHIHIGHVLNKVLKDVIVKYHTMKGERAPYVPGWDCHGLPIEHNVTVELRKQKRAVGTPELRRLCREYADNFLDIQRAEFKRLGVLGDWANPYVTMDPQYEGDIVRELAKLVEAGVVYRGTKPVHWCASCRTALAEAEVEYEDHESPSIYVAFGLPEPTPALAAANLRDDLYVVIWTTTPWTLPANRGVALNPEFRYSAVTPRSGPFAGKHLIVADKLVGAFLEETGLRDAEPELTPLGEGFAAEMERRLLQHPFYDDLRPMVVLGDHVTAEAGTGAVHTAPGHGQEDYVVGARYGLEVANPVGDDGVFQKDLPLFGGMSVWDANPKVVETLRERGALVKERRLKHSYPHCWRCKNPILFRATPQWFIGLDVGSPTIREGALEAIHGAVRWMPAWGKDRILGMMEKRPDWCISRQRAWGVPIVAFRCEDCGETLLDPKVMNHVADIFDQETSDAWFARTAKDLLPPGGACGKCGGGNLVQEANILDVWFDSGVSHAAVCERHPMLASPADLYLEGSDQHRGWFNSSLLESVGTRGRAPFKTVLTHGFVVDAKGRKMSKSLGNVIAPEKILKQYGAEILRLWVAAEDYRNDIRISDEILGHLAEAYRRIRNTARFLLSNLGGFDPERHAVPYAELPELDRWALLRLEQLTRRILKAYEEAEFHVVYHQLNNFCAVDLSALYLDIVKDRLYCEAPAGALRRSAQTVCYRLADALTRLMAPVLSFLAEEIWAHLPGAREASVHLAEMPKPEEARLDAALEARWERLWALREAVTEVLEPQRASKTIGHSLEAVVTRLGAPKADLAAIAGLEPNLADLFIVSGVTVAETEGGSPVIETKPAKDLGRRKCARCWKYDEKTGADPAYPETCPRCASVLREIGHTAAA